LVDYRGKVVLLDFWVSWCSPCLKAMPFYESLQAEDHGFELVILTVNLESPEKARRFVEQQVHTLPTLVDA
jgi:thiol-disulfide isomerase/thioredoxin